VVRSRRIHAVAASIVNIAMLARPVASLTVVTTQVRRYIDFIRRSD
jgi:hypothetical protein